MEGFPARRKRLKVINVKVPWCSCPNPLFMPVLLIFAVTTQEHMHGEHRNPFASVTCVSSVQLCSCAVNTKSTRDNLHAALPQFSIPLTKGW